MIQCFILFVLFLGLYQAVEGEEKEDKGSSRINRRDLLKIGMENASRCNENLHANEVQGNDAICSHRAQAMQGDQAVVRNLSLETLVW